MDYIVSSVISPQDDIDAARYAAKTESFLNTLHQ
jgi:hypothetical protein